MDPRRYPWAKAPTINMTRPVATAIATFVSIDKFIIFPSVMTHPPFSHVDSNFGVLMGRQAHVHPSTFPQHCGIGFLGDSRGSSKPEDEGGKSASGARQGRCDVGTV
jgi:hypothetical protein